MTDSTLKVMLLSTAFLLGAQPGAHAQNPDSSAPLSANEQRTSAQQDTDVVIPESDRPLEQVLENPRIIVTENLKELPRVNVTDSSEVDNTAKDADPSSKPLQHLEQELNIETTANEVGSALLNGSDTLMDLSRLPLTYAQDHIPFLTKRNIIFFGRLELDYANYSSGVLSDDSGLNVRRFRLGLAGSIKPWPSWNYKLELDLTDSENTLSDAYISWHSRDWGTLRIGNQKVTHSMSGGTSSVSESFMERSLPTLAFTLQHRLGVGYDFDRRHWGGNITLFGEDPNEDVGSHGFSTRLYFNPTRSSTHVLHLGGSFMQLYSDDDARLRARPESHNTDTRLVDTSVYPDVDLSSALGLELAAAKDSFTFRSEFYGANWDRSESKDNRFKGWYAEGSWFLTGEKSHYREGKFIRPNILDESGAWEVAARFSALDLNDDDVRGGKEENITLGLNWYSRIHWRFMGNLIKVNAHDGPYGDEDPWIMQVRAQYYF
ncbi:MAG: porin [Halioglobus sp.]